MTNPTFVGNKKILRYVDPDEMDGDHAGIGIFYLDDVDRRHKEPHLSVNPSEVCSQREIRKFFRDKFQGGERGSGLLRS